MLDAFRQFISEEQLILPGQRVLIAVSGGMDSICMASLFVEAGIDAGIVHCNFGLRGIASDGDEYFVREWAANAGLPFYSKQFDTAAEANSKGISIQMAARDLRYTFFKELAAQKDFDLIATAHHRDDAIETFFINLIRGTGIGGIKGIAVKKGNIIRPLLFATRTVIEQYINTNKIRFRHDTSNDHDHYLRNRIRHSLMPALTEIAPDLQNIMTQNFQRFAEAEKIYRHQIKAVREELLHEEGQQIKISIRGLSALHPPATWYWEILHPFGFSEEVCSDIRKASGKEAGKIFFSNTHRLLIDREYLFIEELKAANNEVSSEYLIHANDTRMVAPLGATIEHCIIDDQFSIPTLPSIACMDEGKLSFPLTLRKWKRGDVFHPLGARGKKKLSDFFSDHKFTRFEKENCWLLISDGRIVWVVGHRIAHFVRVTKQTNKICLITLTEV